MITTHITLPNNGDLIELTIGTDGEAGYQKKIAHYRKYLSKRLFGNAIITPDEYVKLLARGWTARVIKPTATPSTEGDVAPGYTLKGRS